MTEVVVIGAGPAGLAAALALRRLGSTSRHRGAGLRPTRAEADGRTTALLPSSVELLKNLGVWSVAGAERRP